MMRKQRRSITRMSKFTQESAKVTEEQVKAAPLSSVCYLKPKATTVFAETPFKSHLVVSYTVYRNEREGVFQMA